MTTEATTSAKKFPKGSKIIRISCEEEIYKQAMKSNHEFKSLINSQITVYPELFPDAISDGYILYGFGRKSKKLDGLQFKKIKMINTGEIFSIYPSFVMPYLIAYTSEVEKGLMLRKHDVPFSTLVHIFGKNEMFWYRAEMAFSRCSIVGTTVKKKSFYQKILELMRNTLNV